MSAQDFSLRYADPAVLIKREGVFYTIFYRRGFFNEHTTDGSILNVVLRRVTGIFGHTLQVKRPAAWTRLEIRPEIPFDTVMLYIGPMSAILAAQKEETLKHFFTTSRVEYPGLTNAPAPE